MVKDISLFELTEENAKEYFFLNNCRMMWIDLNGEDNSKKFRGYNFSEDILADWTNEWLSIKLDSLEIENKGDFIETTLNDLSSKIYLVNFNKIISIYNLIKKDLPIEQRIHILFNEEYSDTLKKHFYSGLLYIALLNKDTNNYQRIEEEIILLLDQNFSDKISKDYKKKIKLMRKSFCL